MINTQRKKEREREVCDWLCVKELKRESKGGRERERDGERVKGEGKGTKEREGEGEIVSMGVSVGVEEIERDERERRGKEECCHVITVRPKTDLK